MKSVREDIETFGGVEGVRKHEAAPSDAEIDTLFAKFRETMHRHIDDAQRLADRNAGGMACHLFAEHDKREFDRVLAGIEAATQPAEAEAPSDAEIEAWEHQARTVAMPSSGGAAMGWWLEDSEIDEAVALMRRLAAERDRAVEALRGLMEAFSGESFLGDPKAQEEALRAAEEVLRG